MIASNAPSLQAARDAYDRFCAWCFGYAEATVENHETPARNEQISALLASDGADLCSTCERVLARDFVDRRAMRIKLEIPQHRGRAADVVSIYRNRRPSP